jgi:hypothetical protein
MTNRDPRSEPRARRSPATSARIGGFSAEENAVRVEDEG